MSFIDKYNESIRNNDFVKCNKILEDFSRHQFTFINQIFGDREIRQFIRDKYPERKARFDFKVVKLQGYEHHIVEETIPIEVKEPEEIPGKRKRKQVSPQHKTKKVKLCSVASNYQNWNVNENDMLCQSYSLLAFFEIDINDIDQENRQKTMVAMYRTIISEIGEDNFLKKLETRKGDWKDYRESSADPTEMTNVTNDAILDGINKTLHDWETFGYHYFIGDGKCPGTPPPPPPEPRVTRSRAAVGTVGGKKKSKSNKSKKLNKSRSKK